MAFFQMLTCVTQALEAGGKAGVSTLVHRAITSALFQLAKRNVDSVISEICAVEEALVS